MEIIDQSSLMKQIIHLAVVEPEKEHCALAIADTVKDDVYRIFDYCHAEDMGGKGDRYGFHIPRAVSESLLNVCKKWTVIPVIVHTHPYREENNPPVFFSESDMRYNDSFSEYAAEIGNIAYCLFIVTDGRNVMYCRRDLHNMTYTFEERTTDEIH